jgi:ATP-binding cassette subfamily B protein
LSSIATNRHWKGSRVDSAAFARARQFLYYHPVATWSALAAGVGSGILYLVLLVLLTLFADLIVNQGAVPSWTNLPRRLQISFRMASWQPPEEADWQAWVQQLGLEALRKEPWVARARHSSEEEEKDLSPEDRQLTWELRWRWHVHTYLQEHISSAAAQRVVEQTRALVARRGPRLALVEDVPSTGILGLALRTEHRLDGGLVNLVAWGFPATWAEGPRTYLLWLLGVAALVALLRAGTVFANNYAAALATTEAVTRLRRLVYHHTHRLGTLAFRALGPAEAVGVFTRHLEAVHESLYIWLTSYFREPVKFLLLLLFALLIHVWIALAFVFSALLIWIVGGQLAAFTRQQGRRASQRAAEQLALLQESLMLMRLVKVYLMEAFNQARVERQLASYAEAQQRRLRGEAFYGPLLVFLGLLAALLLLYLTGQIVLSHELGVTSVIVLATALTSLYLPLVTWLDNRRLLRRGRGSAVVVFEFLDRPGGVGQVVGAEFLPPLSQQLEFDHVTLKEPGTGRYLLQDVSLTIRAGQRVALVGPDDMQKHALVYLIPRFLDPTSGEIRIDGKDLRWVTLDSLRAQIAIVLQHNLVFNDTVANNIGCGDPSYPLPQIIEAAKIAHAHQFIQKLPRGYETPIGELGHPLRLSEQFRIALARAILRDPALLIIEEPTVPLDEETKDLVDDTYARILPGRTTLFLPHRLSTIRHCDQVFLLYNGRIEAAGEHRELLAHNELYRHLQYLEFNEFVALLAGQGVPTGV